MVIRIIDPFEKDIFKCQTAVIILAVCLQRIHQHIERVCAVYRHQLAPQFIVRRMQGNRQVVLVVSLRKRTDLRNDSAGADRDMPGSDRKTVIAVDHRAEIHDIVIVVKRFPRSHHPSE